MAEAGDRARHSGSAARRELGQRLRALREDRELTVTQAAERLSFSQSKLTKIELAQMAFSREDVTELLDLYQVTDPEQRGMLLEMVRAGASRDWWQARRRSLPPRFASYLGLESVAVTLQVYEATVVHGLLQTADYARALLTGARPDLLAHEIDRLVELRLRRQEVLTRADPPPLTLWAVMDEAVLRRQVGGRETMYAQLQQLIQRSMLPNVTLLVMPDDLGAHPGLDGPFHLFHFEAGALPVAYVEGQAGNLYLQKDDDLRRSQQTMNHILAAAPGTDRSLAIIRQIAQEMKP